MTQLTPYSVCSRAGERGAERLFLIDVDKTVRAREHARRQNLSVGAICFEAGLSNHDRNGTSTGADEPNGNAEITALISAACAAEDRVS